MALINSGDPNKPTKLVPGEPVTAHAVTQQGSTFAERAAAAKKIAEKAVATDDVEDKAVSGSESKARKSASSKKG